MRFLASQLAFVLVLIVAGTVFGQMRPGARRRAYGDTRASVIESLLTTFYPGAQVQWDPALMVQLPGASPHLVQVPVYIRGAATGGLEGVASIEWQKQKETFIYNAKHFKPNGKKELLSTQLIIFRADLKGHLTTYKTIDLDPLDNFTEIKTFSIEDWSDKAWPTLHVQYDSHIVSPGIFTTIEWQGTFDANTGQFLERLPFGISKQVKNGPKEIHMFSIARSNPSTLEIADQLTKKVNPYECGDPCVVDGSTLLSQWER